MKSIAINGKFLGANLNGVHRTAAYFSRELAKHSAGHTGVRLLTPPGTVGNPEFPGLVGQTASGVFNGGQGWEMVTLPMAARDDLLVNFCNLAPLLHGNSVVMIHDAQTFLHPEDYTGKQAMFYRALLPWIGKRARRILTVSEFSRGSLVAHGVGTRDKIDVVHNGTDHLLDAPPDPLVLSRHGLTSGKYVMCLGSTKGYKNIRAVFDAMRDASVQGIPLVVAGGPPPAQYEAAGWQPPAGTIFTGFVSDAEMRALLEGAAVFVFPSLTEGFGLPPVEAMHCGCPVVSARAGAMPEVVGQAALIVSADRPDEYRAAIESVLRDGELAARLRAAGSARAAELTWDAAGARLWQVIRGLL